VLLAGGAVVVATLAVAPSASALVITTATWSGLKSGFAQPAGPHTMRLVDDIVSAPGENLVVPASGITINLNGHSLTIVQPPGWEPAIRVPGSTQLTIDDTSAGDTGVLTATATDHAAGIGGSGGTFGGAAGQVTIAGGHVVATGDQGGAGIGGGPATSSDGGDGGTVVISGGIVDATGDGGGAGIGGAYPAGAGGSTTVTGGTVSATGGFRAAGIGGARSTAPVGR